MTEKDVYKFDDRIIDKNGNVVYFANALMKLMYKGIYPNNILYTKEDDIIKYNEYHKITQEHIFELPTKIMDSEERKLNWFYPKEYDEINLEDYYKQILQKNNLMDKKYLDRVYEELQLYKEKGFEKFLRFCIYFSDFIKKYDIVLGVGRGSSVSSYLLYLSGIHLINPIEYGLNIKEFLK